MKFTTENELYKIEVTGKKPRFMIECNFYPLEQKCFFDAMERVFGEQMYRIKKNNTSHTAYIWIKTDMSNTPFMETVNEVFIENIKED